MSSECCQQTVLDFLTDRGGRVKNSDLIGHFRSVVPDPERRAAVRDTFKNYVDNVAFVKTESGVKYVILKKKFRLNSAVSEAEPEPVTESGPEKVPDRHPDGAHRDPADDAAPPRAAGAQVEQQAAPGSGSGSDGQVSGPPRLTCETILDTAERNTESSGSVRVFQQVEGTCSGDMGNRVSFRRENRESRKETGNPPVPEICVTGASPLPAEGSRFSLPGPHTGTGPEEPAAVLCPTDPDTPSPGAEQRHVIRGSEGCQDRGRESEEEPEEESEEESEEEPEEESGEESEEEPEAESEGDHDDDDEGHSRSDSTPKGSRKHFLEAMMDSSPQLRRSVALRGSAYLTSRSDSDSASLVSSQLEEDSASVTLDPAEHEWMLRASEGERDVLRDLLACDPGLVLKRDFVTGFSALHWAAKHGRPELLALLVDSSRRRGVDVSVDVRSGCGYTPLHLAAMQNHPEVVKLLVGAYGADVEVRDHSGRRACQYLVDDAGPDLRDIIGAPERPAARPPGRGDAARWSFKVLQNNLHPLRPVHDPEDARPRDKPLRRKSSLSRMKPALQKFRLRTSQIVHSTSFRDKEDPDQAETGSSQSRPETRWFE
ncbi:ankyrin repeat domain-containing protein SOWAHC-like [Brachyistius frenatus]|uniref:ankyrin repeat domain-containing protein SOWAHC-like n=1 Tax=Brachyistius frenatus TaxID=100188 RepID=UPI0037E9C686